MINEELLVAGITKIELITSKNIIDAYKVTKIDNDKVYYTEFKKGSKVEGEEAYISKKSIKKIKKI